MREIRHSTITGLLATFPAHVEGARGDVPVADDDHEHEPRKTAAGSVSAVPLFGDAEDGAHLSPPSYDSEPKRRYPVLYLHDGQNIFSSAGTNSCFGWGSWELDRTVDRLIAEGRM